MLGRSTVAERNIRLSKFGSRVAVCLPAFNERDNLELLLPELARELNLLGRSLVVVFDDGSSDSTAKWLRNMEFAGFELIVLRSAVRVGKSAGLARAITSALEWGATSVFMMDADGQDDPANIQPMLQELNRGNEVVNARRSNRRHGLLKRYSSRLFNGTVRLITGLKIQDGNSGMKVFSRDAAETLLPYFYGELHRVILVIAARVGLGIGEVRVINRDRLFGSSKYGPGRAWRGLFDLLTVQFLQRYHSKPGHFFSGLGFLFLGGGISTFLIGVLTEAPGWAQVGFDLWPGVGLGGAGMGLILISFGFVTELMLFIAKNPTTAVVRVHETPRS